MTYLHRVVTRSLTAVPGGLSKVSVPVYLPEPAVEVKREELWLCTSVVAIDLCTDGVEAIEGGCAAEGEAAA